MDPATSPSADRRIPSPAALPRATGLSGCEACPLVTPGLGCHRETHVQQLLDFLRIPSVSALPRHEDDVRRAAQWAADHLRAIGVPKVEILETGGHPIVYGEWNGRLTPTSPRTSSTATST